MNISGIISKLWSKIKIMKKIVLHGFIGVFCFAIVTSCGKDVKAPSNKPASADKTPVTSSPVAETPNQGQNNQGCGSGSGSCGSSTLDSNSGGYW